MNNMLKIQGLKAKIKETNKTVLNGIDLDVSSDSIHAIMGPNGAGKSTLAYTLVGNPSYATLSGTVTIEGKDILKLSPAEKAHAGLFLAFQYPVELPGVNVAQFLRTSLNCHHKASDKDELNNADFLRIARTKMELLGISPDFLTRNVNNGFSGGEKKRFEILHMTLLEPKVCILDETDSGLDIDSLKTVAKGINSLRNANRCFIIITHYQRLLNYVKPDHVHIFSKGKIVKSGGPEIAQQLEEKGYNALMENSN